jgi:hypothetical protein
VSDSSEPPCLMSAAESVSDICDPPRFMSALDGVSTASVLSHSRAIPVEACDGLWIAR